MKSAADFEEIVEQIKEKLPNCKDFKEKYLLLSVLPKSWTANQLKTKTGVSYYVAKRVKQLVEDKGILCLVPSKTYKRLDPDIQQKIENFYISDEISRCMPGIKDFIRHIVDGLKITVSVIINCNLIFYPKSNCYTFQDTLG